MIELSLKKGNIARAREMIARTASTGHVDANMLTIRNQICNIIMKRQVTTVCI